MIIQNITVDECTPQTIVIGRRGTYDTMQIAFDLSYLIENYGSGTAVLAVKRSQDESAYPAVVTQKDSTLLWTVNETDTAYVGSGECQLMWYVDGGLAKTIIYPMVVMRDILATSEDPPDGYENWIEHLTELGAETQQNAQNAAQSASEAEQAKDDAVDAKEASEEAARKATAASVHAPIIQNGYWYIWNDGQYVDTGVHAEGQKGDKGDTGEKGDTGNGIESITKTGTSGLVDTYTVTYTDGTSTTFTVTNGAKGDKGDTGATGNGIASIEKTGTSGNVDTYTITYTNGQTVTFTVTNGAVSSVAGKTGAVVLDSGDIAYDESATYQAGSVGEKLQEQTRQLSDKQDKPATAGTAGQVLSLDDQLNPVWADQTGGSSEDAAPVIINTESGDVASFDDGADGMPIKKLVAQIEPVQDLHWYDSPWPAGGGKNKLNASPDVLKPLNTSGSWNGNTYTRNGGTFTIADDGSVTVNGTFNNTTYFYFGDFATGSNAVKLNGLQGSYVNTLALVGIGGSTWYTVRDTSGVEIPAETTASIQIYCATGASASNAVFNPMIRLASETDATFAPYSNICPISGWTGAEIEQRGNNLLNVSQSNEVRKNGGGYFTLDYLGDNAVRMNTSQVGAYYVIWELFRVTPNMVGLYITLSNAENNYVYLSKTQNNDGSWEGTPYNFTSRIKTVQFTEDDIGYAFGVRFYNDTGAPLTVTNLQVEYGQSASAFESYTGNQISVTFPTEAGTVYGGTLTLNPDRTGTLVVDAELEVFNDTSVTNAIDGGIDYLAYNSGTVGVLGDVTRVSFAGPRASASRKYNFNSNTYSKALCNMLPHLYSYNNGSVHWYRNTVLYAFFPTSLVGNTRQSVVDYLRSIANTTPLSFWIPLANPQTFQLTAEQVSGILTSLYGTNNIWADTGDVEVTYPADTKLYIDNKITQAIANALNS